jgi:catechol 2,3-dioxygenase-like lactoylglutathione lyase family enzyme
VRDVIRSQGFLFHSQTRYFGQSEAGGRSCELMSVYFRDPDGNLIEVACHE